MTRILPRAFTLRDLEHHLTCHGRHPGATNASRTAEKTLQHWIKTRSIKRAGAGKTGECGVPLFVRASH